jgi:hypothetical protein
MKEGNVVQQRGLYRSEFEHDNCGIGAIVNIKGQKSHDTVANALKILNIELARMPKVRQVMELESYYKFLTDSSLKSVNLSASFYVLKEITEWECSSFHRTN